MNSPYCYGEQLVVLETFRDFFKNKFMQDTDLYTGLNELNRHRYPPWRLRKVRGKR